MNTNTFTFSNQQLPIDTLPEVDNLDFKPIEPTYWRVLLIQNIIFYSICLLICNLIMYANEQDLFPYLVGNCCIVLLGICNILISKKAFKKRSYALRMHDIIYKKGLLGTTIVGMPFNSVQHVKLSQGILSKRWQLTTIILYGAGGQQQQLSIAGIHESFGLKIKDFILSKISAIEEDESVTVNDVNDGI